MIRRTIFFRTCSLVFLSLLARAGIGVCLAEEPNPGNPTCRAFRSKANNVAVYREADRRSEVIGRLARSEAVCGIAETKEFVSILWVSAGNGEKPEEKPVDQSVYVRVVDLWPPRRENSTAPMDAKQWWALRQNGDVPDDPFALIRSTLPFFGDSPQNGPGTGGPP